MLLLSQPQDAAKTPSNELIISFSYDGNLEALAQQAISTGATVGGPTAMPYNACELMVIAPNGFILIFSQIMDTDRTLKDVMSSIEPS